LLLSTPSENNYILSSLLLNTSYNMKLAAYF
jgi:hypothetical protein